MRFLFFIVFATTALMSASLDITAKLIPRIIMQSSVSNKSKTINIALACAPSNLHRGRELKKLMPISDKGRLLKTTILDVTKSEYSLSEYQAVYICDLKDKYLLHLYKQAKENEVLTFSDSIEQFKKGAMFYIEVKRKINIYLNTKFSDKAGVGFNPTLLKYVKSYDAK